MKAVVMAGGEGSRLRPLTSNRPKPLVPVCNQTIMEHILLHLKSQGIEEVVSTVYYLADEIQSEFGDGSDLGMKLTYSQENSPLGTAGSVKKAEAQLKDETFIIVSGDALTDCDFQKALAFHKEKKGLATLILYRVPSPLEFGVVILNKEGRITRFLEKPSPAEVFSDTVNTGMYILEPEIFAYMEANKNYDWSSDIFPKLLEDDKPMYGYVMDSYWCDVGSFAQYQEAHEDMLVGKVNLPMLGKVIDSGIRMGSNCTIESSVEIRPPVQIGRNVKIKKGAIIGPYTVIGDGAFIEEGAIVERSIVWDNAYLGENVGCHSAIVCSRATIKRDSVLREEAVIGERSIVDVGSTVRPRVKIYPDKTVERGSIVTMSLIHGNKWRGSLFRELGVAGLSNVEITPDFAVRLGMAYGTIMPTNAKIVTSRDSTRSSRMIKRALIASLLSTGCSVFDLRSSPVPIMRHFVKASGAQGGINVRKLPGYSRATLIELLDAQGAYLPRNLERKVETMFFREEYRRTDPDDLGQLEYASRAVEAYQSDFLRLMPPQTLGTGLKVVCDFGFSSISGFFPGMLAKYGAEVISLNAVNDAKMAPRTQAEIGRHLANLSHIVGSLNYDLGVLFTDEGERMTLVDNTGAIISGNRLFGALSSLMLRIQGHTKISMTITAPLRLETALVKQGAEILRTRSDTRSLMASSTEGEVALGGDERGGFIFPAFHGGFDAMFGFCNLIGLLQKALVPLSEIVAELPDFAVAYESVTVPWEMKGLIMRKITEESNATEQIELVEGVKILRGDEWVLLLPDTLEPKFHIYAESPEREMSIKLAEDYARKVQTMVQAG